MWTHHSSLGLTGTAASSSTRTVTSQVADGYCCSQQLKCPQARLCWVCPDRPSPCSALLRRLENLTERLPRLRWPVCWRQMGTVATGGLACKGRVLRWQTARLRGKMVGGCCFERRRRRGKLRRLRTHCLDSHPAVWLRGAVAGAAVAVEDRVRHWNCLVRWGRSGRCWKSGAPVVGWRYPRWCSGSELQAGAAAAVVAVGSGAVASCPHWASGCTGHRKWLLANAPRDVGSTRRRMVGWWHYPEALRPHPFPLLHPVQRHPEHRFGRSVTGTGGWRADYHRDSHLGRCSGPQPPGLERSGLIPLGGGARSRCCSLRGTVCCLRCGMTPSWTIGHFWSTLD